MPGGWGQLVLPPCCIQEEAEVWGFTEGLLKVTQDSPLQASCPEDTVALALMPTSPREPQRVLERVAGEDAVQFWRLPQEFPQARSPTPAKVLAPS